MTPCVTDGVQCVCESFKYWYELILPNEALMKSGNKVIDTAGEVWVFHKKEKDVRKKCLLSSPISCLLSPPVSSCLLPPISCILSAASYLLHPVSCILSPASCLLPPISCLLLSEGEQAAEGGVMGRMACAWHCVRVIGGGRQRRGGSACEDEKRGFWLAARHLVPNSGK